MGKPKAPAPPDPQEVAGAQTAQNIGTAITQQQLNNVNQVTPYGSLTYQRTIDPSSIQSGRAHGLDANRFYIGDDPQGRGFRSRNAAERFIRKNNVESAYQTSTYTDPSTGNTYDIPQYTAVQTLSKDQRKLNRITQGTQENLARLGRQQSSRLGSLLSEPIDTRGLPKAGDPTKVDRLRLKDVGSGPDIQRNFGRTGDVVDGIDDAGPITKTYGNDFSEDRNRVEAALLERMRPGLDQDRNALEARLASQGIRVGSEAYQSAMDDFGRQTNDARLTAILGAGQEHSRLSDMEARRAQFENNAQAQSFGQNATQAQFHNQAQQQRFGQAAARTSFSNDAKQQRYQNRIGATQINNQNETQRYNADMVRQDAKTAARNNALQEAFTVRNQPINEISALLSGSQVQNPNFITPQTAQLANTDVAGITMAGQNAQMQAYGQQMGAWNGMIGGLAGLGGAAIMASDERVKTDIQKIGKTDDGQNLYRYRYKDGGPMQIGLMAQEVEKKKPGAVLEVDGMKMVNYDKALGASK